VVAGPPGLAEAAEPPGLALAGLAEEPCGAGWERADGVEIGGGRMDLTVGTDSTARTVLNRRRMTVPGGISVFASSWLSPIQTMGRREASFFGLRMRRTISPWISGQTAI